MSVQPTVDVIITMFNRTNFIFDTIDSVVFQSYTNIRIIIIDDGSDISVNHKVSEYLKINYDKIKKYNRRIFYLYKKNGGISSARNTGIKFSSSGYLCFLDDDDCWRKKKIELQMNVLFKTDYKCVYTNEIWFKNGEHLNQLSKHQKYSGDIFEKVLPLCIISPSSVLFERKIIDDIGFFDESFEVCEDYEYWIRLASKYKIYFLDNKLIIKKGGHSGQLSKKYDAMDLFRIRALKKNIENNNLNECQKKIAVKMMIDKCRIYVNGCLKRGKQADEYIQIIEQYSR